MTDTEGTKLCRTQIQNTLSETRAWTECLHDNHLTNPTIKHKVRRFLYELANLERMAQSIGKFDRETYIAGPDTYTEDE